MKKIGLLTLLLIGLLCIGLVSAGCDILSNGNEEETTDTTEETTDTEETTEAE